MKIKHPEMEKTPTDIPLLPLGLAIAVAFWVMEAVIHAFVLEDEGFIEALLYPDPNELWMRLLIVLIIVGASYYASTIVEKLKLSESALKKERDRAKSYFDVAGVIFVVIGSNGRVLDINSKGCEILSRAKTQILGCDWFEAFIPASMKEGVRAVFSDLISGRVDAAEYHENPVSSDTLGERYIAWHNTTLADENGAVYATLSSGMDITERIRIQNAFKESEEKYRLMIEESNDMIWTTDPSGSITFTNKRCEDITGYSTDELMGKTVGIHVLDEDIPIVRQAFEGVMKGEKVSYEARIKRKDGSILFLSINAAPIIKDGTVAGKVSFGRDITKERLATAELKERLSELERFMKATVNREFRIKELSDEVERLKAKNDVPSKGQH